MRKQLLAACALVIALAVCPGCLFAKHRFEIDLATSKLSAESTCEEVDGDYEYSASRPDGTYVTLKVRRTNKHDAAAQAKVAEQQLIQSAISAGIQAATGIASKVVK